jgi:hypothetical protein
MTDSKLTTPVAFFIFNRPHTTALVFDQIRQAKPAKLLVVADGPRAGHPDDEQKCTAVRAIIEQIDWDCEVLKNYADTNSGCRNRMISGLNWVFDTVEEAILLEDDTLPHPTFFPYCQELLEKYRNDERVMMICGNSFLSGNLRTQYSYYFSPRVHVWGWATWRRAWQYYDPNMALWPEFRDAGRLHDILVSNLDVMQWHSLFDQTYKASTTWDFQWVFTCWTQQGFSIMPNVNLVTNIGFGPDATHMCNPNTMMANFPSQAIDFPLKHPSYIVRDAIADDYIQKFILLPKQ